MLTTIKGYYDHGRVILEEMPQGITRTAVLVTFLTGEATANNRQKRKLGGLEGKVNLPEDFNEPLDDLKDYI